MLFDKYVYVMNTKQHSNDNNVRLDKWLWAARFYKTRSIARNMIDGGKVQYNKQHTKPGKIVEIGAQITLWQGFNQITVIVKEISSSRQCATIAQKLYEETTESITKRQERLEQIKNNNFFAPHPDKKPNKKDRREIIKIKNNI